MVGCVKVGGPARFARPDKLATHVRAVHYSKGTKVVCPDASCADIVLDLDLFGVHVKFQHLEC
jgi:hypothetical protein